MAISQGQFGSIETRTGGNAQMLIEFLLAISCLLQLLLLPAGAAPCYIIAPLRFMSNTENQYLCYHLIGFSSYFPR